MIMKKACCTWVLRVLCIYILSIYATLGFGQQFNDVISYLNYLNKEQERISEDMWSYTSAVAHGKSAKKVDNRRKELINTTLLARKNIADMPGFNNDASLRDSMVSYLTMCNLVLNEDYSKIVDLEEIAEQSYDLMEAYLTAQEKANEKLDIAGKSVDAQVKIFAQKNQVQLVEAKDKTSSKLEKANQVFKYYNPVYLIFFKCYKQEGYFFDALNKNDVNAMEQNKNTLLKFAEESLKKIDTVKAFKNDLSVKTSCRQMLDFYKYEASVKAPVIIDYFLKKENFEKIKTSFDAKMEMARTQDDVNQYNKAAADYNKAIALYNNANLELQKKRNLLLDNWNKAIQSFFDRHVPKN
jgi:hypothetical protein